MQQDLFTILIEKYLANKASVEEIHLLEEYYQRLGRKDPQQLKVQEASDIQTYILAELQGRMHASAVQAPGNRTLFRSVQGVWWAAAAVLITIVSAVWYFYPQNTIKKENVQLAYKDSPGKTVYKTIDNPKGHTVISVTLGDGTKVWLNEASRISYPETFAGSEREMNLVGEAYFEVVHDAQKPFKIKAGNELIEDLGTRFNVNAYAGNPLKVTLLEGIVQVNGTRLAPGQQYMNGKVSVANTQDAVAWKDAFVADEEIVFTKFPSESPLVLKDFIKIGKGVVQHLFFSDSGLITFYFNPAPGDYFFNRYSLKTLELTGKYMNVDSRKGIRVASFAGIHRGNTLWAYDLSSQRLQTVDLKNNINNADSLAIQHYSIEKFCYSVQLMGGLQLLGDGAMHTQQKIQKIDLVTGKEITSFGDFVNIPKGMPANAWKDAYSGFLFLKPTEEKVAIALRYTDRIEIFDLHTQKSKLIKGPENYAPEFMPIKVYGRDLMVMGRTEKTRMAFQKGTVTNRYIYLLYSGNYDEQVYNPQSQIRAAGKYIYVYDWNGNPIRKYSLDRYVTCIAVSEDDKVLYAFDRNTENISKVNLIK
ncbi:MAG: BF3164 family lipoprotein [Bacteroidota bacterium]